MFSFRDKYFGLPGDIANASKIWGAADGNDGDGSDCYNLTTPSTTSATCNGNGDGLIGYSSAGNGCNVRQENFRLWQQLQYAGLVEGSFSGTLDAAASGATLACRAYTPGLNVPRSRIANAGFAFSGAVAGRGSLWGAVDNRLFFGTPSVYDASTTMELFNSAISPEEAWNIDTKMDDGLPFIGGVVTNDNSTWGHGLCSTATALTAT